jgi:cell division protein FtsI (penicillin-binding protein 3)
MKNLLRNSWRPRAAAPGRARASTPADMPGWPGLVRLDGGAKVAIETARIRLVIMGTLFTLAFAALAARSVDVTLLRAGGETALEPLAANDATPAMQRRPIVDRNGVLLAANLPTVSLYADARRVPQPAKQAEKLAAALPDLSAAEVAAKLGSGKSFVWIKRHLTPAEHHKANALGIPGLSFQPAQRRIYPHGALLAHVLGATDIDNRGIAGIEQYFDAALDDPARGGEPLALTIDLRVQHAVRDEMRRAIARHKALGGGALVLDARNGEIVALVSLPDFDPAVSEGPEAARFNRITQGSYELGSALKTLTAAMALDAGVVGPEGGYDATSPIRMARFTIRDNHPKNRWLSVPEIVVYSSNIGAAKMALDVGAEGQRMFLDRMGLLRRPTLQLPELSAPQVPRNWREIETMTIGFGHGLAVSPLQLANAVAALVNGGVLRPATLVRDGGGADRGLQVIRPATSDLLRGMMWQAVDGGTGKQAAVEGYLVGGKTGTAEKAARGGYDRKALLNTFAGAFPMNAPRYVVIGILDEPEGSRETRGFATAGWNIAPAVGAIIGRIAPLLGVAPVDDRAPDVRSAMHLTSMKPAERKVAAH